MLEGGAGGGEQWGGGGQRGRHRSYLDSPKGISPKSEGIESKVYKFIF
jgi:hypothetical protein